MEKIMKIKKGVDILNISSFVTAILGLIIYFIGFINFMLNFQFTVANTSLLFGIPIVVFAGQLILRDKLEEEKIYLVEEYVFKDVVEYVEENKIDVDVSVRDGGKNTVLICIDCEKSYKDVAKQKISKYGNKALKEITENTGDKYNLRICI